MDNWELAKVDPSAFSDLYKDVHGVRPHFAMDSLDPWEIRDWYEYLLHRLEDEFEQETHNRMVAEYAAKFGDLSEPLPYEEFDIL